MKAKFTKRLIAVVLIMIMIVGQITNIGVTVTVNAETQDDVVSIDLGCVHSGAIKKDGSLWMWGSNGAGQLGDGTEEYRYSPVKIMDDVVSVSLGDYHSGAIKKDGSLWMWGDNFAGRIGDGTTERRHTPVKIMDDVVSVSLGDCRSGAIKKDGSLWMWGYNEGGQLGDGTKVNRYSPVKIMDDVVSVSLGFSHGGAIKKDGSLWMWGYNWDGQIGSGSSEDYSTPIKIMDDVASISFGGCHSGAIKKDGSLWMWGDNWAGQLGDGTTEQRHTPVKIMDDVVSVSLGDNHSGVIKKDGSLWMWGYNKFGQLGDGIEEDRFNRCSPVKIMDDVISISLGYNHSGAIKKDKSLWMWGYNSNGQLGDRTNEDRATPMMLFGDNGEGSESGTGGDDDLVLYKSDGKSIITEGYGDYKKLEYLAMAKLAYNCKGIDKVKNPIGKTIEEIVPGKDDDGKEIVYSSGNNRYDDPIWKGSSITNIQFYKSFVPDWTLIGYQNDNASSGFVGLAVKKENKIIISYCGSEGIKLALDSSGNISMGVDWDTDMRFALYNQLSEQFDLANKFYQNIADNYEDCEIVFTGHSLGGALAGYESILTGHKAYTFDGAEGYIIDLAYMFNAFDISSFEGIDKSNITNYTDKPNGVLSIADVIQHTSTDSYNLVENEVGSADVYEDNGPFGERNFTYKVNENTIVAGGYTHKLFTSLEPVGNIGIKFTSTNSVVSPNRVWNKDIYNNFYSTNLYSAISSCLKHSAFGITGVSIGIARLALKPFENWLFRKGRVMLGTSRNDTITAPNNILIDNAFKVNTSLWGGQGQDELTGYSGNDILVAGTKGTKTLDGQAGDDVYIITSSADNDTTIYDCLGTNTLYLKGFSSLDNSDIQILSDSVLRIKKTNQKVTVKRLSKLLSDFRIVIESETGEKEYTWDQLEGKSESFKMMANVFAPMVVEAETINDKIQIIDIDGTGNLIVKDSQGNTIDTISNIAETTDNIYKDYGYFYTYNSSEGKKLMAYILPGYNVCISGDEKINLLTATANDEEVKNIKIIEDIDLDKVNLDLDLSRDNINVTEIKKTSSKDEQTPSRPNQNRNPVKSILVDGISHKIAEGKKITLAAKVLPENASNKSLTWTSSNTKVATVSQSGVVKVKKKTGGKSVTITATAKDGSGVKGSWTIKSMKGVVKSIKIKGAKPVKAGKKLKLKATVKATKGANKILKWTSSNPKFATVTSKGVVKTKKAAKGKKVKITAMATDGSNKKKSVKIKIK